MDRLKSTLVAVDFSPCSAYAFKQAARIAAWDGGEGRTLAALHVIALPTYMPTPARGVERRPIDLALLLSAKASPQPLVAG